jgi:hypothetical protein
MIDFELLDRSSLPIPRMQRIRMLQRFVTTDLSILHPLMYQGS